MKTCVGNYTSCGSVSKFYVIDDKRGFKEFDIEDDAIYAHDTQQFLAEYNLAPRVLSAVGKIRYRDSMSLSNWGYITEVAKMICCGGNKGCEKCCGDDGFTYKMQKKVNKLCGEIDDLNLEFMDAHIGNVGYVIRNGSRKLVCIDCGQESIYWADKYEDANYE